eukprot:NODE_3066_length_709_cov_253.750000_g2166_i0.p1 GENE.NODE_3066_length_709_cov_253.750000_g2166_i0~~NODE_3066_length_709_cov_253.750000_g2166_i0.p1  ORF type:complete len:189 (+),score=47.10 NODE_3066_length_709_cov_253.750000_g2166_i0:28-567(+)
MGGMRPTQDSPGRTYRFYNRPVLYPFGYGLSYTTFVSSLAVQKPNIDVEHCRRDVESTRLTPHLAAVVVTAQVTIANLGEVDSDTVVILYLVPPPDSPKGSPLSQLAGFERVHLRAGERPKKLKIPITSHQLALADAKDGLLRVQPGTWRLRLVPGDYHPDQNQAEPHPGLRVVRLFVK